MNIPHLMRMVGNSSFSGGMEVWGKDCFQPGSDFLSDMVIFLGEVARADRERRKQE
jgi:hypothetical protein